MGGDLGLYGGLALLAWLPFQALAIRLAKKHRRWHRKRFVSRLILAFLLVLAVTIAAAATLTHMDQNSQNPLVFLLVLAAMPISLIIGQVLATQATVFRLRQKCMSPWWAMLMAIPGVNFGLVLALLTRSRDRQPVQELPAYYETGH